MIDLPTHKNKRIKINLPIFRKEEVISFNSRSIVIIMKNNTTDNQKNFQCQISSKFYIYTHTNTYKHYTKFTRQILYWLSELFFYNI